MRARWGDEEDEALWEEHSHTCLTCGREFSCCEKNCCEVKDCESCTSQQERERDERDERRRLENLMVKLGNTAVNSPAEVTQNACKAWEEGANWVTVGIGQSWHNPETTLWGVRDKARSPDKGEFLARVGQVWKEAVRGDCKVFSLSRKG